MLEVVLSALVCVGQPVSPVASSTVAAWLSAAEAAIGRAKGVSARIEALPDASAAFIDTLAGLEALHRGDLRSAARRLPQTGLWTPFAAMAAQHRPGGLARARSMLAAAARKPDADATTLFMAALAYAQLERMKPADRLLRQSVAAAKGALDDAFAPDPAAAIARLVIDAVPEIDRPAARLRMAEALAEAGRRGSARRLLSGLAGPDAARVRWLTWAGVDPRRAVAAARRAATARSDMALVVAEADFERGRAIELSSSTLPDALWRARRNRLRAAVALKEGRPGDALDAARAAARQDPKNAAGVAKIVEAMLAEGEASRARAFAEVLLERRPIDVNPYDSLLAVHRAEALQQPEAFEEPGPALEVRHRAWTEARARLDRARARRERLLGAVRDADSGLKATGLTAARTADPTLGLPIDIALAKYGAAGTARAARDRILAACGRHFRDWLTRRGDWDRVKVTVSPYRRSRTVRVALSDADPGRCPPPTLKARAIRNRGRL